MICPNPECQAGEDRLYRVAYMPTVLWCEVCGSILGASGHSVPAQAQQFVMLREAIGVCVPSCLRVLLDLLPADADVDRDVTTKVLARVEKAMAAAIALDRK